MKKNLLIVAFLCSAPVWAEINISPGSGGRVVHTETIGGQEYQVIEIVGPGGASTATVTATGSLNTAVTNMPATYTTTPGTGTTTVSGSVAQTNAPASYTVTPGTGTFPVSGTFFQATQPISGSIGQVGTYAVVPATGTFPVSGTFFQSVQPVSGNVGQMGTYAVTSSTGIFSVNPASTFNTVSTNTVIAVAVQLASGTAINPFIVTVPVAVFLASGTASNPINVVSPIAIQLASGTATSPINVVVPIAVQLSSGNTTNPLITRELNAIQLSSGSSVNPWVTNVPVAVFLASGTASTPINVVSPIAVFLASGTTTNPFQTNQLNVSTITHNGVPQPIFSTMTVPTGMLVSSTSFLQPFTQGTTVASMADSQGRQINADIPWEMKISTYNAALGGDTVEHVFISSATGNQRIRICQCNFMNASATGTGYTIYASTSNNIPQKVVGARAYPISAPISFGYSSVGFGCSSPFFVGDQGGQITYKAGAVQVAAMACTYYTQ